MLGGAVGQASNLLLSWEAVFYRVKLRLQSLKQTGFAFDFTAKIVANGLMSNFANATVNSVLEEIVRDFFICSVDI